MFLQDLEKQLGLPAIEDRASNPLVWSYFGPRNGIECMIGKLLLETGFTSSTGQIRRFPVLGKCFNYAQSSTNTRKIRICSKLVCNVHSIQQSPQCQS